MCHPVHDTGICHAVNDTGMCKPVNNTGMSHEYCKTLIFSEPLNLAKLTLNAKNKGPKIN